VIVLRDHGGFRGARNWKALVSWLLVPPVLLATALGVIVQVYKHFLGHGPDLLGYVDLAIGFSATWDADLTNHYGQTDFARTVTVMVVGFLLLVMAAGSIARTVGGMRNLPTALGLAFGVWAISSYTVGLPSSHGIFRLMPYLVLSLVVVLAYLGASYRHGFESSWVSIVKTGTISVLAGLLIIAYTNVPGLTDYARAIRTEGFHGRDITVGLPRVDASLGTLLAEARVKASDPIFYAGTHNLGQSGGNMMPVWVPAGETKPVVVSQQWMPGPVGLIAYFSDERKQRYMERTAHRMNAGGWLIERRAAGVVVEQELPLAPWFFENVDRTHVPTKIAQNADWQLVWYEPKGEADTAALAGERSGRVPGIPADLLIDGQSLSESVLPPVWGYFGPEWSDPAVDGKRRCTSGTGTLYLFTPSARDAWLTLDPVGNEFGGTVQVEVNGDEVAAAGPARSGDDQESKRSRKQKAVKAVKSVQEVQAPLVLDAGWNTVRLTLVDADQPAAGAPAETPCAAESAGTALRLKSVDVRSREG
jgi:hypothetical protein